MIEKTHYFIGRKRVEGLLTHWSDNDDEDDGMNDIKDNSNKVKAITLETMMTKVN